MNAIWFEVPVKNFNTFPTGRKPVADKMFNFDEEKSFYG